MLEIVEDEAESFADDVETFEDEEEAFADDTEELVREAVALERTDPRDVVTSVDEADPLEAVAEGVNV